MATLDSSPFDDVLAPGSDAHTGYVSRINDMKSNHVHFDRPPRFVLRSFEHLTDGNDQSELVRFRTWSGPATILNEDDEPVDSIPGGTLEDGGQPTEISFVKGEDDQWLVAILRFD